MSARPSKNFNESIFDNALGDQTLAVRLDCFGVQIKLFGQFIGRCWLVCKHSKNAFSWVCLDFLPRGRNEPDKSRALTMAHLGNLSGFMKIAQRAHYPCSFLRKDGAYFIACHSLIVFYDRKNLSLKKGIALEIGIIALLLPGHLTLRACEALRTCLG